MKATLKIYFVLVISLIFISSFSYAQKTLEGHIFDMNSKKPLPYAAILIGDTGLYTTTNEDGKFEIFLKRIDSLEIRYLGYETTKVSVDYFLSKKIFYLKQFTAILDEVVVNAKGARPFGKSPTSSSKIAANQNERSYELLYKLIKKYRKSKKITESKAYFTLNSKAYFPSSAVLDTVPLEQIEGFYSGKHQLSKGILDLELKTGRFGQNRLFTFYSLNHISLLQGFNLFSKNKEVLIENTERTDIITKGFNTYSKKQKIEIFPQHLGNMSLNRIKKRYHLKLIKNENYDGTVVSFEPKNEKNDIFSGKIFFKEKDLTIEKAEFFIENPKSFKLRPIVNTDSVSLNNLKLSILFNPIDLSKIQYYDLDLDMEYYSGKVKRNIASNIILYLYDYNTSFTKPYFTNTIDFENDYDRLLTLPASDEIWKQNYPYPRSKKNTETTNFFKQKNQFYSYYENKLPLYYFTKIRTSLIVWGHQKSLLFPQINNGPGINLNFSYALNPYKNKDGNLDFIVKTLFDAKTSFFKPERTSRELDCINLAFDICELNRHYLLGKIKESMTLEDVKILSDKAILEARVMTALMFEESSFGLENDNFNYWKNKIHTELAKYNKS